MVSQEIKISPQEVRTWSLSDLVDLVSDILSKNDAEAMSMYFPEGYKPNRLEQEMQKRKMENN